MDILDATHKAANGSSNKHSSNIAEADSLHQRTNAEEHASNDEGDSSTISISNWCDCERTEEAACRTKGSNQHIVSDITFA